MGKRGVFVVVVGFDFFCCCFLFFWGFFCLFCFLFFSKYWGNDSLDGLFPGPFDFAHCLVEDTNVRSPFLTQVLCSVRLRAPSETSVVLVVPEPSDVTNPKKSVLLHLLLVF